MPQLDFTGSEVKWYAREQESARELINVAAARGRALLSKCLEGIFESHKIQAPAEVTPLTSKDGQIIGVRWGKDEQAAAAQPAATAAPATAEAPAAK